MPAAVQMRVRRMFSDPHGFPVAAIYEAVAPAGVFEVRKEFYAQGPSMFTWVVAGDTVTEYVEFRTKRAALAWVEQQPPTRAPAA